MRETRERLIERRRRRATGTTVEVWEGFDGNPGYQTICVEHGGICEHYTRREALAWAPLPQEWCPECQGPERAGYSWDREEE